MNTDQLIRTVTNAARRQERRNRAAAQERYWKADEAAGRIMKHLSRPCDPLIRSELLSELAWYEQDMAEVHVAAFGPQPMANEDGRDLAESLASSTRLIDLVWDTWNAAIGEAPLELPAGLTKAQSAALTALACTADLVSRADLLSGPVHEAFADEVGGQAAEILVGLAWCERKAAEPGRRPYRARRYPRWLRAAGNIAGVLLCLACCLAAAAGIWFWLPPAWLGHTAAVLAGGVLLWCAVPWRVALP